MKNMLKSRMKEKGLFDEEDRLRVLSKLGDSLEKLNEKINWEIFKPILKKSFEQRSKRFRRKTCIRLCTDV